MALFYADENFDYGVVERLRSMGHDVVTVQEAGEAGRDDARVLERATDEGRCVLTFDRADFERLHRQSTAHAGIVGCTRDNDQDALAARIDAAVAGVVTTGRHLRVNRPAVP